MFKIFSLTRVQAGRKKLQHHDIPPSPLSRAQPLRPVIHSYLVFRKYLRVGPVSACASWLVGWEQFHIQYFSYKEAMRAYGCKLLGRNACSCE